MCGICGAFRIDGDERPPLEPAVLRAMTDLIEYRGPDDAGHVEGDGCSLGARRLSIIDVEGGHQPFGDERGRIWAAQNGEIYNHDELRRGLAERGHALRSQCDTEVLPHLYEEHGVEMTSVLRGMYAFAVWDRDRREGLLVRDRLGVKPLYWARAGNVVVFGSELKCIAASGLVDIEIDPEAIAAYLSLGYIPAPMSPLKNVRKLQPGERLVVADGTVRVERYWHYPAPEAAPERRSAQDWAMELRERLEDSVRMRLMSDVPLGAMLSGGLDSSLIVALMAKIMERPVDTFAVGFQGEDSELPDARRVATALGASHHELEVGLSTDPDELERLVWHLDEPLADLSSTGFLALCELAVGHVTVALSGQGADELFGGYRKHRVASLAETWGKAPAPLRSVAAAAAQRGPGQARRLAAAMQSPDPASRLLASSALITGADRDQLFAGALAEHAGAARRVMDGHASAAPGARPLEAALYLDARLGLVDDMLHYFDRCSMACSLEVRVPFLDHELVEWAATMPTSVKVHRLQAKHVLRLAAKDLVPDFVLTKRKRGFFNDKMGTWLGAPGGANLERLLLAEDPAYAAVVDPEVVRALVADWRGGDHRHTQLLLALVMLEVWLSSALPKAVAAGQAAASAARAA
jgi:asparagine synthase (glutamine-hydrolysing)